MISFSIQPFETCYPISFRTLGIQLKESPVPIYRQYLKESRRWESCTPPQDDHDQILKGIFKEITNKPYPKIKTCKYVSIARFPPRNQAPLNGKTLLKHHQMIMWKDYPLIPLRNWVYRPPLKSKVVQKHLLRVFEQMDPWPEDQGGHRGSPGFLKRKGWFKWWNVWLSKGLVKTSATLILESMWQKRMSLAAMASRTWWYAIALCFFFKADDGIVVLMTTLLLSLSIGL